MQQVDFIAEDQFGVLEANVLHELECKYNCMYKEFSPCSLHSVVIGEWFEENIDSEFQSDALAVVNHAHSFLSSMTCTQ